MHDSPSPAPAAGEVPPESSSSPIFADTHVHLQSTQFDADLDAVLSRARGAGVRRFLCPGWDRDSSRAAVALAARIPDVMAACGVHPHDAKTWDDALEAETVALLASGRVAAAGEMGLDYYYEHSPRDVQRAVLCRQLRLARQHAVPVVVHNRDSDADMAAILADEAVGLRVVLHAFNAAPALVELGVSAGFWFGIGGFLTFKNHPLADCVRDLPRQSLLLETDAPYLSPHPMRGRRNEPAHVPHVARRLAEILDTDMHTVAAFTSANFARFLGEAPPWSD